MKAFPTAIDNGHSENQDGMDLRDYFAAKAMEGIISVIDDNNSEPLWDVIAKDAYTMADAMMGARK